MVLLTSPAVYEMVKHVEQLAMRFSPRLVEANRAMVGPAAALLQERARRQNANDLLSVIGNGSTLPRIRNWSGRVSEDDPLYGTYVTEGTFPGR